MHDAAIRTPDAMALFLDVDGTLIEFAATPSEVSVPGDLPETLSAASRTLGGALALVSGRPIDELDHLFAPLRLPASGLHGAELRASPDADAKPAPKLPPHILEQLREQLRGIGGLSIEDKRASIAVHFRAVPEAERDLRVLLSRFATKTVSPKLDLMAGELVFELKAQGYDKGTALARFMEEPPFAGRQPVFVADHPIDQAGFVTASRMGGMGLSVGRKLPGAAGWFSNPEAVRTWLKTLS